MNISPRNPTMRFTIYAGLAVAALAIGAWHARSLAFVNDDAFISFRYAKHFVEGSGLVYNVGERVEGYTNFLWTMIIAAGIKAGIDPVPLSMSLGILFHLLTLGLCAWFMWSVLRSRDAQLPGVAWLAVPLTPLALALHRDFNVYATSGLETALFAFLVLVAFVLLATAGSRWSFIMIGITFVLMILTRPDGVVFLAAACAYVVLLRKDAGIRCLFILLPVIILYIPYWIWRYAYYGFPFPNTFYAKAIDSANYENGIEYLWLYVKTYYAIPVGLYLALVGAAMPALRSMRDRFPRVLRRGFDDESLLTRTFLLAVLFVVAWLAFIVRIGGDFMFARFLIPITPILFIMIESLVPILPRRVGPALALLILAMTYFRFDQYTDSNLRGYIADEWKYYPVSRLWQNRSEGLKLRKYFEHIPLKVAFSGTQAQVVYYADPALAIECATGLTDTFVAHQHIEIRGRPGHEKPAPISYLVKRKVNFLLWGTEAAPIETFVSNVNFDGLHLPILVYENAIMSHFEHDSTVQFADVPKLLDSVITSISTMNARELHGQYQLLKTYYFDHNDDSIHSAIFLAELQRRSRLPADSSRSADTSDATAYE